MTAAVPLKSFTLMTNHGNAIVPPLSCPPSRPSRTRSAQDCFPCSLEAVAIFKSLAEMIVAFRAFCSNQLSAAICWLASHQEAAKLFYLSRFWKDNSCIKGSFRTSFSSFLLLNPSLSCPSPKKPHCFNKKNNPERDRFVDKPLIPIKFIEMLIGIRHIVEFGFTLELPFPRWPAQS